MIRFRLKELMLERENATGKRVSMQEIAEATNIGRGTLSRIANQKGANTTIEKIEKLCLYFDCGIEELVQVKSDQ
jgi:putative transcriptional regulator